MSTPDSPQPEPHTDATPPEGPGGPDAVPDWEAAEVDPKVPDQPLSAQVADVPDEIEEPEDLDDSDGAGGHSGQQERDPANEGKESLTEPGDDQPPEEPA